MNLNVLKGETAFMKAVRTGLQSLIALGVGLWAVPGVPAFVHGWINHNLAGVLASVAFLPAIVAFVWHLPNKDVPNV